jgi:hypothetical protein
MSTENTTVTPEPTAASKTVIAKAVKKVTASKPASVKSAAPATKKNRVLKPVKKVSTPVSPATKTKAASPAKTVKPSVKPKTASSAKPSTQAKAKPVAEPKTKKPKLVRDSFTFPKDEYQAIAALKVKALGLKQSVKKSEILRAGLMLISSLNDKAFLAALNKVPALKTGRPAKS